MCRFVAYMQTVSMICSALTLTAMGIERKFMCRFVAYMQTVSLIISALNLTAMSIKRYVHLYLYWGVHVQIRQFL